MSNELERFIFALPEKKDEWDFDALAENPNLTPEIILKFPKENWNLKDLISNRVIPRSFLEEHFKLPNLDLWFLLYRPEEFTLDDLKKNQQSLLRDFNIFKMKSAFESLRFASFGYYNDTKLNLSFFLIESSVPVQDLLEFASENEIDISLWGGKAPLEILPRFVSFYKMNANETLICNPNLTLDFIEKYMMGHQLNWSKIVRHPNIPLEYWSDKLLKKMVRDSSKDLCMDYPNSPYLNYRKVPLSFIKKLVELDSKLFTLDRYYGNPHLTVEFFEKQLSTWKGESLTLQLLNRELTLYIYGLKDKKTFPFQLHGDYNFSQMIPTDFENFFSNLEITDEGELTEWGKFLLDQARSWKPCMATLDYYLQRFDRDEYAQLYDDILFGDCFDETYGDMTQEYIESKLHLKLHWKIPKLIEEEKIDSTFISKMNVFFFEPSEYTNLAEESVIEDPFAFIESYDIEDDLGEVLYHYCANPNLTLEFFREHILKKHEYVEDQYGEEKCVYLNISRNLFSRHPSFIKKEAKLVLNEKGLNSDCISKIFANL